MADIALTPSAYVDYLLAVTEKIASEKDYITELDAATGDGDHWVNMNTGFTKLAEKAGELRQESLSGLFKKAAMVIMSGVGGSSGILYASAYLKASAAASGWDSLNAKRLCAVLEAELQGIIQRGNGQPGFKTMIDPLFQAVEQMKQALDQGGETAVEAMRRGAREGMEATRDMEAVRGRACYQPNKGVGHLDPGAVTMFFQLDLLADAALKTREE